MLVFAYGSLMWNPGFPHDGAVAAFAPGWSRRWCVHSTVHRGTPEVPGLVLGLVPGEGCVGTAYTVRPGCEMEAFAYLDRREMAETGYRREEIGILVPQGPARAVCYVADRPFEATAGDLVEAALRAQGLSGRNLDYMLATGRAVGNLAAPDGWPAACLGLPSGAEALLSERFPECRPPRAEEPGSSA